MNIIAHIHLNSGRADQTPKRVVVHSMAEYLQTESGDFFAVDFLRSQGLSAHVFITPSGVRIRSREDHEGAWHAKGFNIDSLGIEFLVPGVHDYETFLETIKTWYITEWQYQAGVLQVKEWIDKYGISQIDRHSDLSPRRKYDPGVGFPWGKFLEDVGGTQ